jgi:hypothetical protein
LASIIIEPDDNLLRISRMIRIVFVDKGHLILRGDERVLDGIWCIQLKLRVH